MLTELLTWLTLTTGLDLDTLKLLLAVVTTAFTSPATAWLVRRLLGGTRSVWSWATTRPEPEPPPPMTDLGVTLLSHLTCDGWQVSHQGGTRGLLKEPVFVADDDCLVRVDGRDVLPLLEPQDLAKFWPAVEARREAVERQRADVARLAALDSLTRPSVKKV